MQEFPKSITDQIGYYVYLLVDPENDQVFYVGKGTGNRVFAHVREVIENPSETDKLQRIRGIKANGHNVQYEILRHGLTETEAVEVEAAIIDFLGLTQLTNENFGYDTGSRGRMTVTEIIAKYNPEPIEIQEAVLLIIPNKYFERNISADRLYEISRGNWAMGKRRDKAKYAFTIVSGVVHEVYRIDRWFEVTARSAAAKKQNRWRFDGAIANEMRHYLGRSVASYLVHGARIPFRYVNC